MKMTLDETAEAFGTPTRKELDERLEKELKEQEAKRFGSRSIVDIATSVWFAVFNFFKR